MDLFELTFCLILCLGSGPRLEADALSVAQQKSIGALVEMVVVLGILPNLLPGVGQPPDKRSQFLQDVLKVCRI